MWMAKLWLSATLPMSWDRYVRTLVPIGRPPSSLPRVATRSRRFYCNWVHRMPWDPFPRNPKGGRSVETEAFRKAATWPVWARACILEHANGTRRLFLDAWENKAFLGWGHASAATGFEACIKALPGLYIQLQRKRGKQERPCWSSKASQLNGGFNGSTW